MQCSVCFENYDKSSRQRLKLTCEHIVCKICLYAYKLDVFKCPICLQDFQVFNLSDFEYLYSSTKEPNEKSFKDTSDEYSKDIEKLKGFVENCQLKVLNSSSGRIKQDKIEDSVVVDQGFSYGQEKGSRIEDKVEDKQGSLELREMESVKLIVRTRKASGFEIVIPVDLKVEQLKIMIQNNIGNNFKCLIYDGKVLNSKDIIRDLSLSDNDVVYIVQNQ